MAGILESELGPGDEVRYARRFWRIVERVEEPDGVLFLLHDGGELRVPHGVTLAARRRSEASSDA